MVKRTGITKSGLAYVKAMIDNAVDEEKELNRICISHLGDFWSKELKTIDDGVFEVNEIFAYQRWAKLNAIPKRFQLQCIPVAPALLVENSDDIEDVLHQSARHIPEQNDGQGTDINKFGSTKGMGTMRISEEIELETMVIKFDFRLKPVTTSQEANSQGINQDVVIEYKIISCRPEQVQRKAISADDEGDDIDPIQSSDIFPGFSQNGGITVFMKKAKPKHSYKIVRQKTIILNTQAAMIEEKPNDNGYRIITSQVARKSCQEKFRYGKGRKKNYPMFVKQQDAEGDFTLVENADGIFQKGKNLYLYIRCYYLDPQYTANQFIPIGTGSEPSPVDCRITEILYYRDGQPYTSSRSIAQVNP